MLTSRILRGFLFLFFLFVCTFSQGQGSRKGTYDADCDGYTFHLPEGSATSKNELTLRLRWHDGLYPPAWKSAGWSDITATQCSRSGKCENATSAQIHFDKVGKIGKRFSGGFKVQFASERQEGTFNVKYHHTGPKMICE
jgi:hypothetical protein